MSNEIWKQLPEGFYSVSNLGRVRRDAGYRCKETRILIGGANKKGYIHVMICIGNRAKSREVHVLVAKLFLGDRPDGMHINHIDFNPGNNCVDNLEYVTPTQNVHHTIAAGRNNIGQRNGATTISDEVARKIKRDLINRCCSIASVARKHGVKKNIAYSIQEGHSWTHVEPWNDVKQAS